MIPYPGEKSEANGNERQSCEGNDDTLAQRTLILCAQSGQSLRRQFIHSQLLCVTSFVQPLGKMPDPVGQVESWTLERAKQMIAVE
jgi:hypothetical protein